MKFAYLLGQCRKSQQEGTVQLSQVTANTTVFLSPFRLMQRDKRRKGNHRKNKQKYRNFGFFPK
jgi:hypothetical protein